MQCKAVNASAQKIVGISYDISIRLEWCGKQHVMLIPLNDFDVIIGLEFLKKAKIVPIQFERSASHE